MSLLHAFPLISRPGALEASCSLG